MSLNATLRAGVKTAFKALGDLNSTLTYKSFTGDVTRDIEAGTSVPITNDFTVKLSVFVKFSEKEIDTNVSVLTDSKLLIPGTDMQVAPKASDTVIEVATGRTWEIQRRLDVPGSSVCILHVRTSK